MYPWIVRNITFPLQQKRHNSKVLNCLRELEESQWYSKSQLEKLQFEKLQKLLVHCYENVPYYREIFKKVSLHPKDINDLEKFSKIPILTKQNLRENTNRMIAQDKKYPFFIFKTSGSTGIPLVVYIDKKTAAYHYACKIRGRKWWGWDIGDRNITIWGADIKSWAIKRLLAEYLTENRIYFSAFDLSEKSMLKYYKKIKNFKPKFMYGYVSTLYELANFFNQAGLDADKFGIQGVSTTAEILYDFQKDLIEKIFQCPVINEYGCIEVQVIAFQCPKGNMHISSENLFVEFIKNDNLDGMQEIVVTDLNNYLMPLLRYKIGDIGKTIDEKCSCGRGLPLMSLVTGRHSDMVILGNGKLVHPLIFQYIAKYLIELSEGTFSQWKIIQKSYSDFLIYIVVDQKFKLEISDYASFMLHKQLGENINIDFEFVSSIPREASGKLRYFVSEVPQKV
ncbi:MAG: hypothetical protein AB1567_00085 [bacterium]